jgi:hypothetical protein
MDRQVGPPAQPLERLEQHAVIDQADDPDPQRQRAHPEGRQETSAQGHRRKAPGGDAVGEVGEEPEQPPEHLRRRLVGINLERGDVVQQQAEQDEGRNRTGEAS